MDYYILLLYYHYECLSLHLLLFGKSKKEVKDGGTIITSISQQKALTSHQMIISSFRRMGRSQKFLTGNNFDNNWTNG